MIASHTVDRTAVWRCLHCRAPLGAGDGGLRCEACGRHYPVLAGIPLLVREPPDYVRAERAALAEAAREARQRGELLGREPYAGLPDAVIERHRNVLAAEAAQAETLLALLGPTAPEPAEAAEGALRVRRPGWRFETLVPYLLRDWTGTAELQQASARINAALLQAFPEPQGRAVAFAGCGAGGLLADVPAGFARVLGFDLTLPILAAARRMLDGETLDLPLPRALNADERVTLRRRGTEAPPSPVVLVAMDALDTALADRSVDGVVTVFLTDILPDPRALADEIRRVLVDDGVWINYGPSGNNLRALWRFDQVEAAAFFAASGFTVIEAAAERVTNLDITGACPPVSYRNAMCYLTIARKTTAAVTRPAGRMPDAVDVATRVPRHFPGARLVHRLDGGGDDVQLQHEHSPDRTETWELGGQAARMMVLVDGKRSVGAIADLLARRKPSLPVDETLRAFGRFFARGLLR